MAGFLTQETGGQPRTRAWGLGEVAISWLGAQFLSLIGTLAFVAARGLDLDTYSDALSIAEIAVLQLPLWLALIGGPVLFTRLKGNGPVADLGWSLRVRDAPLGVAVGVACQFLLVPLLSLPVVLLSDIDQEEVARPARELADRATGPGVLVLVFVVVIAAPVAEELFFRGFLQGALDKRVSSASMRRWAVPVITGVLFGLTHFQPVQFLPLAGFGIVLAELRRRSGDLSLCTWVHLGFNATTVAVLVLTR